MTKRATLSIVLATLCTLLASPGARALPNSSGGSCSQSQFNTALKKFPKDTKACLAAATDDINRGYGSVHYVSCNADGSFSCCQYKGDGVTVCDDIEEVRTGGQTLSRTPLVGLTPWY